MADTNWSAPVGRTSMENERIERLQSALSDAMAKAILLSVDEASPEYIEANVRFERLLAEWNALVGADQPED